MKIDKRTNEGKKLIEDIEFDTRSSKAWVREIKHHAAELILDPDRENREKECECINCHYDSRLGGAAMTDYECQICHKHQLWGSTNTPKFCDKCAKDNNVCRHCGSKLYGHWEV